MLRLALLLALLPTLAVADVTGSARVIDGDTIVIGTERIRLHAIDAPESHQACRRHGVTWFCGAEASRALRGLVGDGPVRCDERGRDRYGRLISVCWANDVDLNARMVATDVALVYRKFRTDYGDAEPLHKRALAIREKALGRDHPDVATTLSDLAVLYQAQGRYANAEPIYKRSLAISEKALGRDHPSVATTLHNLAAVYRAQGRYADAEPLYRRALTIVEKVLGPETIRSSDYTRV